VLSRARRKSEHWVGGVLEFLEKLFKVRNSSFESLNPKNSDRKSNCIVSPEIRLYKQIRIGKGFTRLFKQLHNVKDFM
jgi:hypothetical protein